MRPIRVGGQIPWGGPGFPGRSPARATWAGAVGCGAGERPVGQDLARLDHAVLDRAGEQRVLARRGPPGGRVLGTRPVDVLPEGVLADRHSPPVLPAPAPAGPGGGRRGSPWPATGSRTAGRRRPPAPPRPDGRGPPPWR